MDKHTKGPWKLGKRVSATLSESGGEASLFDSVEAEGYLAGGGVALVHIKAGHSNAPLIIAAPDLLAACKWVLEDMAFKAPELRADPEIQERWFKSLEQAIAKAEGAE